MICEKKIEKWTFFIVAIIIIINLPNRKTYTKGKACSYKVSPYVLLDLKINVASNSFCLPLIDFCTRVFHFL